jgi:hypothetical protein
LDKIFIILNKIQMKKVFSTLFIAAISAISVHSVSAQSNASNNQMDEKAVRAELSKYTRPSPAEMASQVLNNGAKITIDYSAPTLKGRTMGKDVEPKDDTVWRAGANAATLFATDKDITIAGKSLPAGKYTFFTLKKGSNWTLIFNKVLVQPDGKPTWGAYTYGKDKAQNALEVTVKEQKSPLVIEKLFYNIEKDGRVSLLWGDKWVSFRIK